MNLMDKNYNKTDGPAKGNLYCADTNTSGNCWVFNRTCETVRSSFKNFMIKLSDKKVYFITPDNYLVDTRAMGDDKKTMYDFCMILF
jgi:hypothetical protein